MGEAALLVSFGNSINERTNSRVHDMAARLRDWSPDGLVDVVPAYSSVLVRFDPSTLQEEALREHIDQAIELPPAQTRREGRRHIVPVQYGGEAGADLEILASERGLADADVIRLHTGRDYRVYFLGFMPGFAYMGKVHRNIAAPRLQSPRVRVPAGSVGIAASQTGIYPLSSPGGWRLIGRTSLRLWDPARRKPALLAAGDTVRFVPSEQQGDPPAQVQPDFSSERPAFRVLAGGTLTAVQDPGRPGYGAIGLSQGGWSDPGDAMRSNALLGNQSNAPVLELTWTGPTLLALRTTAIALGGADFGCTVDSVRVPVGLSWLVRAGSTLRFEQARPSPGNSLAYLAVAGGFDVPTVLGSSATYLPAGFGGYCGRGLREGDILGVAGEARPAASVAGRFWPKHPIASHQAPTILRFTRFSGPGSAANSALRDFTNLEWQVGASSDRVGMRLSRVDGQPSPLAGTGEAISFGVVRGAIQVPPDGNPVVLGPDHQTTGGYPVLGVVCEADWPLVAQLCPGGTVRFEEVSADVARSVRAQALTELHAEMSAI